MKKPFALTLLMLSMCLAMGQVEYFIPFPPYNLPLPKGTQKVTGHYAWGKADSIHDPRYQRLSYDSKEYDADGRIYKMAAYFFRHKSSDTTVIRWMLQNSPDDPNWLIALPCDEFGVKLRLSADHYPQIKRDSTGRIVRYRDFCELGCERRTQYVFQYDSIGKLIQIRAIDRSWRDEKHWKFSYDETGKLTCLQEMQPDGDADTYQYRYDDQGRLESMRQNLSDFVPKHWFVTKYTYDAQGRIVKAVGYQDNRRQVVHWTNFFFYGEE